MLCGLCPHPVSGISWKSIDTKLRTLPCIILYYGAIKPYGHDELVRLSYWETPEEAFEEYKRHKQADILIMADKYENKVPKKVYDALLRYEVKPFVED